MLFILNTSSFSEQSTTLIKCRIILWKNVSLSSVSRCCVWCCKPVSMLEFVMKKYAWFITCFYLECILLNSLCYWVHFGVYDVEFTLECMLIEFTLECMNLFWAYELLSSLWSVWILSSRVLSSFWDKCCMSSIWSVYYWVHFGFYEFILNVWIIVIDGFVSFSRLSLLFRRTNYNVISFFTVTGRLCYTEKAATGSEYL